MSTRQPTDGAERRFSPAAGRRPGPRKGVGSMAQLPFTLTEALTFDDVLLRPGHSLVMPSASRYFDPPDAGDHAQSADRLLGHGYGDGGAARHRHGAGRRHGRHPPEFLARRPSRPKCAKSSAMRAAWWSIRSPSIPTRRSPTRSPSWRVMASRAFPWSSAAPSGKAGEARRHPHQSRRSLRRRQAAAGRAS